MSRRRGACRIAVVTVLGAALACGVAAAAPQPGFDVAPDPPTAGETVTFTAHDGCAEPVTCVWDFGDGTPPAPGAKVVEHVYAAAGVVTATLTTDDPTDEEAAVTTERVLVVAPVPLPNRPPVADVSAAPTDPLTGEQVLFDSSGSSDPDGDELTREWDLDGNGTFETGNDVTPFRSYSDDGTVTATLRVTDPHGASDVATVEVQVRNRPPGVAIAASPAAPLSGDPVSLQATATDPDGVIASYAWDLDGDEAFDDGNGPTASRAYDVPGSVTARVRVTDDDGASTTADLQLTVGNRAPTATYTYAPNPVVRGEPVTFTAEATDPEGRLEELRWDFGGDGTFDAEGESVTITFPASREPFRVDLVATDMDGASTVASSLITAGNLTPTATVSASATAPFTGDPVAFTSTAADPDGVVSYAWDLDGDEAFDDGNGPTASRAFAVPGRALVRLRVTDDDGASVTVEQEVIVQARPAAGGDQGAPPAAQPATVPPRSQPVTARIPPRMLAPFPVVRFAGALTRTGARFTLFTVRAPRAGARVSISCRGDGCPDARSLRAAGLQRLVALQRSYRAGARIIIRVTRHDRIGKYVRVTIRRGKPPARRDACLWPGSRTPRPCPG